MWLNAYPSIKDRWDRNSVRFNWKRYGQAAKNLHAEDPEPDNYERFRLTGYLDTNNMGIGTQGVQPICNTRQAIQTVLSLALVNPPIP